MNELKNEPLSRVRSIYALPVFIELLLADMTFTAKKEPHQLENYHGLSDAYDKAKLATSYIRTMVNDKDPKIIRHVIQGSSLRVTDACKKHLNGNGDGRPAETYVYTILRVFEALHERELWAVPYCEAAKQYDDAIREAMEIMLEWVNRKPDLVKSWESKSIKMADKLIEEWQKNGLFQKPIRFN